MLSRDIYIVIPYQHIAYNLISSITQKSPKKPVFTFSARSRNEYMNASGDNSCGTLPLEIGVLTPVTLNIATTHNGNTVNYQHCTMAPTQLEIKVKSLQRLVKEEGYYQQEAKDQAALVEKLKSDPKIDPYDLKKQVEVLEDTQRLLPTLYEKIKQFMDNLSQFLESYSGVENTADAKAILDNAEKLLASVKTK